MSTLNEIGQKFGTDKASTGKAGGAEGTGHDYLRIYEKFFEPYRQSARRVLEIGVQKGASVKTWEEYFPNATIYGLDINPALTRLTSGRIDVRIVDQSDAAALDAFARDAGPFDIVIEDGSHMWAHQITTLKALLPHVAPGGVYVVEDLHTSYSAEFGTPGAPTGVDFVVRACQRVIGQGSYKDYPAEDHAFMKVVAQRVDYVSMLRRSAAFFIKS